jgi:hypothetical protein
MGKEPIRAASTNSGWALDPPLQREAFEALAETAIGAEGWNDIRAAYRRFGRGQDALRASRLTRKKDDPNGWYAQKEAATRDLEVALERLGRVLALRTEFMREATSNYFLQQYGRSGGGEIIKKLGEAHSAVLGAFVAVERADPQEIEVPSDASLRQALALEIKLAIERGGGVVTLSDGRALDCLPEGAAESDLTPFERLISAIGIHEAETPAALARWVRRAMGQNRGDLTP